MHHSPARPGRVRRTAALVLAATLPFLLGGCTLITELTRPADVDAVPGPEVIGDVPEASLPYYQQALDWISCGPGIECATAIAPMDWSDPAAHEDIELALVKLTATGDRLGSLFTNPGGPGASGADFVEYGGEQTFGTDLREHYDIIGWDPRGVGSSSAVECLDDAGMDRFFYSWADNPPTPNPTEQEIIDGSIASARYFADACDDGTGELLEFVDTASTVNDLDMLRATVADPKLNFFGFSYGTEIGAHYIDTFPANVGRMVLDGAVDPTLSAFDANVAQQVAFGEAAKSYLADCLAGPQCPFTGTVDDAIAAINEMMTTANATLPRFTDGRLLTSSVIDTAISATMYNEESWPSLTEAFRVYQTTGDPTGFFVLSDSYYGRDAQGHWDSNLFEAFIAIGCLDSPVETDPAVIAEYNRQLNELTPFGQPRPLTLGDPTCEQWPHESRATLDPVVGAGAAPVLVVGTTGDPATPIAWAESLAQQLESATLVRFEGEGHIAYGQGDACVEGAIEDYLVDGTVPDGQLDC